VLPFKKFKDNFGPIENKSVSETHIFYLIWIILFIIGKTIEF